MLTSLKGGEILAIAITTLVTILFLLYMDSLVYVMMRINPSIHTKGTAVMGGAGGGKRGTI